MCEVRDRYGLIWAHVKSKPRVIQFLRTTNRVHALYSFRLLSVRLEHHSHDLRLQNAEPHSAHLLTREYLQSNSTGITLTQALEFYLSVKGLEGQGRHVLSYCKL